MINTDWDKEIIRNIRVDFRKKEEGAAQFPDLEIENLLIKKVRGLLSFQEILGDEIYSLSPASFYGLALIHAALYDQDNYDSMGETTAGMFWNMALEELKEQAERDEHSPRPMICRELKGDFMSPENIWEPADTVIPIDFETFLAEYKKRRDAYESSHGSLSHWQPPKGKVAELMGRAYLGVDFGKAKEYLTQATVEAPDSSKAWEALGDCLMRTDPPCHAEAEHAFQKALDNLPADASDLALLSYRCKIEYKLYEALWAQGRKKEALELLEKLSSKDPAAALPELVVRSYEMEEFELSKRVLAQLCPARAEEILSFPNDNPTFQKMVEAVEMGQGILRARDAAFGEGPF